MLKFKPRISASQDRNQPGSVYSLQCSHNSTLVVAFSTCMFLSICSVWLSSGWTTTFCIPCEVWSLTCISEAERVLFPTRKMFTVATIRETGIREHIWNSCWTAVSWDVAFLFHEGHILQLGLLWCVRQYSYFVCPFVYACMCCLRALFALCILTLNMTEEKA